ncbi:MAG: type II toxin-antitoxin system RelE/ParE family toxin [Eggerthellaceae bacterium]|nr:type II toxin-antitoxin system RelE/ParE family toxin [Eggerthellaceae bacterium]
MFHLEFYETEEGKKPTEEFMINLESKMRTKAIHELMLLREKGNLLREPFSKAVGDGLFELRIKHGSDDARIFYFFFVGAKIVLTNGFVKKMQKAPSEELKRARRYKTDYERRH